MVFRKAAVTMRCRVIGLAACTLSSCQRSASRVTPTAPPRAPTTASSIAAPTASIAPIAAGDDAQGTPVAVNPPPTATLPRPRLLWRKVGAHTWPGLPPATPPARSDEAYIVTATHIERREKMTDRVLEQVAFPRYFLPDDVDSLQLLVDGERVALLSPMYGGFVMTWKGTSAPAVLNLPLGMETALGLRGDTLYLHDDGEKHVLGAYDLATPLPSFASLAPAAALAAARAELGDGDERWTLCDQLGGLTGLHDAWLDVAARRSDPLWACAIQSLRETVRRGDGVLLRRLNQQVKSADDRRRWLEVLAKDDDRETTALLVEQGRRPEPRGLDERWAWEAGVRAAREQVWRTGRASSVGWCPAQPITRRVRELETRAADGSIGTAHPLLFQRIAGDTSWCLICQARRDTDGDGSIGFRLGYHGNLLWKGDTAVPYLVVESGTGWSIDEFITVDARSNYMAIRRGGCLEIVDLRAQPAPTITTLPDADLRDNGLLGEHRGAAFDARGERMLYLRGGSSSQLVVRHLSSGRERTIDVGPGVISRARFDPEGHWVQATVIPSGQLPIAAMPRANSTCSGRLTREIFLAPPGPAHETERLISMDDGTTYEGDDIVAPFGKDVLRRASDGAIVRWTPTGAKTVIVPASCGGRLLHVDAGRRSVVVSCSDLKLYAPPFASRLWLFRAQGGQDLKQHILTRVDHWELTTGRGVWIDQFHVDMETAQIVAPPPLGPREVRVTRDFQLFATGGFPERGDGMVLRPVGKQSIEVWSGPLRWSR